MKFPTDAPVKPQKLEELRARLEELGIDLADVEEKVTKGGGRGGQKVNKTSSSVQLRYAKLELVVRCQKTRQKSLNRFHALRQLADTVETRLHPERADAERDRIRKQKARRDRRGRSP